MSPTKRPRSLDRLALDYVRRPNDRNARRAFLDGLVAAPEASSGVVDQAVAMLASDESVDHGRLIGLANARLIARAAADRERSGLQSPNEVSRTDFDTALALGDPLMVRLLSDHVVPSSELEELITTLRSFWLSAIVGDKNIRWPGLDVLSAVALQMQTTEWVYEETIAETAGLSVLEARFEDSANSDVTARQLLVYAMYRPLSSLEVTGSRSVVSAEPGSLLDIVLTRHLDDAAEEAELRYGLARLTEVSDEVSRAVAAQYDERPYPRWRAVGRGNARSVDEVVASALASPALVVGIKARRPRVLVAGCGTGRHAVLAALRYENARVLAVDLSRTALAYAARQARDLGITNISFAQADLLELSPEAERFDVIEAVGVLHHMADPEAGWKSLRRLLTDEGLMKVGLYSRSGRSFLDPVSASIRDRGLRPTTAGIRAVRKLVRELGEDSPARHLSSAPDFYSQSGIRDLLFHEHEVRFDIPRIARAINDLNLEFLGFELASPARQAYTRRFPDDPTGRSLENWDEVERAHPYVFAAMYRFWTRARTSFA